MLHNYCYIGATIQPLNKRLWHHRDNSKKGNSLLFQKIRELGKNKSHNVESTKQ